MRRLALVAVALAVAGAVASLGPIAQPREYHEFADARTILGIGNFWNVVSNVPFLLTGMSGLALLHRAAVAGHAVPHYDAYRMFFLGACLIAPGSGWYHAAPDNLSLVFDRLPMTLSFMALLSLVIGRFVHRRFGAAMLWPAIIAGFGSVLYWYWTETRGAGDLRPYVIVQFLPVLLIPAVLILFRGPGAAWLWAMVGAYVAAKLLESGDAAVLAATGTISGHALKHVVAALGMYSLVSLARQDIRLQAGTDPGPPLSG